MNSLGILSAKVSFALLLDDKVLKTKDKMELDSFVGYVRENLWPVIDLLGDRKEAHNMIYMAEKKLSWQYVYCCLRLFHGNFKKDKVSLDLLGSHMKAFENWKHHPKEMEQVENVTLYGAVRYDPEVVAFTAKHFGSGLKELHFKEPRADILKEFEWEYFFNKIPSDSEIREWEQLIGATTNLKHVTLWQSFTGPFKTRNILEILQKEWTEVKEVFINIEENCHHLERLDEICTEEEGNEFLMSFATLFGQPKSQLQKCHVFLGYGQEEDEEGIIDEDEICLKIHKFCQQLKVAFPNMQELDLNQTSLFELQKTIPQDMMPLVVSLTVELDEEDFVDQIQLLAENFPKLNSLFLLFEKEEWTLGDKLEEIEAMVQLKQVKMLYLIGCYELSTKMMNAIFKRMPNLKAFSCAPQIFGRLSEESSLEECFTPSPKHLETFKFAIFPEEYFSDHNEYEMSQEEAKQWKLLMEKLAQGIPNVKISFV